LDKGYPLGLIDPTELAHTEVKKLFPNIPLHTFISIGAGDVDVDDIHDLLLLAYPPQFFPILSMFQRRQVPREEMLTVNEGLRDPKKICDILENQRDKSIRSISLAPYRRLQIGSVKDVGPNDFLSVKEVSERTTMYLHGIERHMSLLLGGESTMLHWAAWAGDETSLRRVLSTITLPDLDSEDDEQRTPLSYAAENGHAPVVNLLLNTKTVQADSTSLHRRTPLSYAAENGHAPVVSLLLMTGAVKADSTNLHGRTPLSYAAENGHAPVVNHLLKTGTIKADSKGTDGRTPLSYAAENGHAPVVNLLLKTEAVKADSKGTDGRTPLSYAVENGHASVVKLLLQTKDVVVNSEVLARCPSGQTPLSPTSRTCREDVKDLLEGYGADRGLVS